MPIDLSHLESFTPEPIELQRHGNTVRILITYSNTSLFQSCRWKYWARQVKMLSPNYRDGTLTLGHAYHNGIENYYKGLRTKGLTMNSLDDETLRNTQEQVDLELVDIDSIKAESDDATAATKTKAMVKGFVKHFRTSPYQIQDLEKPFLIKMEDAPDFEIDGTKYEFWLSGKIDAIMQHTGTGLLYLGEWKTCTQFADFVSKVKMDNQPWHYMLCYFLCFGVQPQGVVYRIARKTLIRQRKDETELAQFFNRIVEEYETKEKEYFHEEIIYFDTRRINRHIEYLNQIAIDIKNAFIEELWYRNRGSCFNYNKPCPYMSLCNTYTEQDFNLVAESNFKTEEANSEIGEVTVSDA